MDEQKKTISIGSTVEPRIISVAEHDAIVVESDQNRLEYTARKALVAKRTTRSQTIV